MATLEQIKGPILKALDSSSDQQRKYYTDGAFHTLKLDHPDERFSITELSRLLQGGMTNVYSALSMIYTSPEFQALREQHGDARFTLAELERMIHPVVDAVMPEEPRNLPMTDLMFSYLERECGTGDLSPQQLMTVTQQLVTAITSDVVDLSPTLDLTGKAVSSRKSADAIQRVRNDESRVREAANRLIMKVLGDLGVED